MPPPALFGRRTRGSVQPDPQDATSLWWPLIALLFCLLLIAIGAFVLSHLGLSGLAPIDPRDLYYAT